MKIAIFGAGALGSLMGALLSRVHEVTLIGRDAHMDAVARSGLRVEGDQPFVARLGARSGVAGLSPPELVILTVKSYDTAAALDALSPIMGKGTVLLSAQNGLGNWELARRRFPHHAVLGASVIIGAALLGPGRVRWHGGGESAIGGDTADAAVAQRITSELARAGLAVRTTENLAGALWLKAIINAAINPLTAVHRVLNGRLLDDPSLKEKMQAVCDEAVQVAKAEGVQLPVDDAWIVVEQVARQTAQNPSSMLQSIERHQRTEIDAINGTILEAARRRKIPCPQNQALYDAIKRLEAQPNPFA